MYSSSKNTPWLVEYSSSPGSSPPEVPRDDPKNTPRLVEYSSSPRSSPPEAESAAEIESKGPVSSPQATPSPSPSTETPEVIREAPRRDSLEHEVSGISTAAAAEPKGPTTSTPASAVSVDEVLSGSPGHTPYPHKRDFVPRR